MVSAVITGIGAVFPEEVEQRALWDGFFHRHFAGSRLARRIFDGAGVNRRHAVANPVKEDLSGWSTGERMVRYAEEAPLLGHQAVDAALSDAGLAARDVGQLTVASCTGYSTPGLDIELARSLGLRPTVRRLLVGHMGCYAALPALDSVAAFVATHREPAVLLCAELTSLHVQPPTTDPEQLVAHALFSDAAVAIVLRPVGDDSTVRAAAAPTVELVDTVAHTDVSTSGHMTWDVTDFGFRMGLSSRVPEVLARHLPAALDALLAPHTLSPGEVNGWAVHPGGPRILDTVQETLDLPSAALTASRAVLAEHGNCSSATVLLVLDRLLTRQPCRDGDFVVAMTFGPGLTLYAALLRVRAG